MVSAIRAANWRSGGGLFGQHEVTAQYGFNSGIFGFYVAGRALDWDGWRPFSQDRMRDVFHGLELCTRIRRLWI
jgi:hypothetical protein